MLATISDMLSLSTFVTFGPLLDLVLHILITAAILMANICYIHVFRLFLNNANLLPTIAMSLFFPVLTIDSLWS